MKRLKIFFYFLPVLLFALLWTISVRKRSETSYILAQYPANQAFKAVTDSHLRQNPAVTNSLKLLFHSTWFLNGNPKIAINYIIYGQGYTFDYRSVPSGFIQDSRNSWLIPTRIAALKAALRDLPPNAAKPELKDLLIVSFMDGETLTTRIYNRRHLPPSVSKIYQMAGLKSDSDRHPAFRPQPFN